MSSPWFAWFFPAQLASPLTGRTGAISGMMENDGKNLGKFS